MDDKTPHAFVYVVGPADGPQKIGVTADLDSRRKVLQVGSLANLSLSFSLALPRHEAFAVERHVHWMLREHRVRGEWFSVTPTQAAAEVRSAQRAVACGKSHGAQQPPSGRVGREKEYPVRITLPLEQSMADAVDAAREPEEPRVDLIRKGIARELKARAKRAPKPTKP